MDKILNFGLLSRPENWVIIWLILYLSALLAHFVFQSAAGADPLNINS